MELKLSENDLLQQVENIKRDGYTILENVISCEECKLVSSKLDALEEQQRLEFGIKRLEELNEVGIIRALIAYDDYFANFILHPTVYPIVSKILGESAIIHLQNGIVVHPQKKHGQSHFHTDLAKDFVTSKPLSINVFWMISDFNDKTGATWVVPGTHKESERPSDSYLEKNSIQLNAKAGSVFIFDSMLIHKGGSNTSDNPRRAVNHQYTRAFIKQQINLPILLGDKFKGEEKISQVLGYWTIPPKNVEEFRSDPDKRTYRKGQG